jgi:predicted metal-binding membrane protein
MGAGAFQFSRFKNRCLTECRTPVGFLVERYRPGTVAAFRLGMSHGAFCVGCCWALMLLAFAAGAGNLLWMAALTTIMVIERTVSWGASIVRPVGAWLMVLGVLVVVHPIGFPAVLGPG